MSASTMQLKAYTISIAILQEMMTVGWEIGTTAIVRCVEGLPANATFEYVEPGASSAVTLVFSHPTWPAVASVDDVPRANIVMQTIQRYDKEDR